MINLISVTEVLMDVNHLDISSIKLEGTGWILYLVSH